MANTLDTLADILLTLAARGVSCDIFGGWAEEILGLRPPWQHRDIDLVLQADDFRELDLALTELKGTLHTVPAKHFAHKRAFVFRETLCEVVLIGTDDIGPVTQYWGDVAYRWEMPLLHANPIVFYDRRFTVVSAPNLLKYRREKASRQPNRWRRIVDKRSD